MLLLQPLLHATLVVITVDLYSGVENPAWRLDNAQQQELRERLAELEPIARGDAPALPALGYRGLVVSVEDTGGQPSEARVFHRWVYVDVGGRHETYQDDRRQLQRWLLSTAGEKLSRETVDFIDQAGASLP